MNAHIKLVNASCRQYPKWEELLEMTGSFWCNTLSQLCHCNMRHCAKRDEIMKDHIQANNIDLGILTLSNSASDLVACNPSYICAKQSGAIPEEEIGRKREEECRNMLLILLDKYLPTTYRHMLSMYYQSPESNGQTEENAMRSMPWLGLMALFKKACKGGLGSPLGQTNHR